MCGQSRRVSTAIAAGLVLWCGVGCGGHSRPPVPDGQRDVLWESEWTIPAEPAGIAQPLGMTSGEDGTLLVTGAIEDEAAQRHELLIQRLEPDGRQLWSKRYWIPGPDSFWSLSVCPAAFTSDGGICAGAAGSILKLDASGQVLWFAPNPATAPPGDYSVYAARLNSLWPGPDGGVIAIYDRWDEGRPAEDGSGYVRQSTQSAALLLDADGRPVWAYAIGPVTEGLPEDPWSVRVFALLACAIGGRSVIGGWGKRAEEFPGWPAEAHTGALLLAINESGVVEWQGLWAPRTDSGGLSSASALTAYGGRLFLSAKKTEDVAYASDVSVGVFSAEGELLRETRLGHYSDLSDLAFLWSPSGPVLVAAFHSSNRFAFRDVLFIELDGEGGARRSLRRNVLSPHTTVTAVIDAQGNYTFLSDLPEDDPLLSGWEEVDWPVSEGQGVFLPSHFETVALHPRFLEGIEVEVEDCPGVSAGSPQFDPAQGVIGLHKVKAP